MSADNSPNEARRLAESVEDELTELKSFAERLTHERGLLAEAIVEACKAAGITNGDMPMTGPQLLLLAEDLVSVYREQRERVTKLEHDITTATEHSYAEGVKAGCEEVSVQAAQMLIELEEAQAEVERLRQENKAALEAWTEDKERWNQEALILAKQRENWKRKARELEEGLRRLIQAVEMDYTPTLSRGKRSMEAVFQARSLLPEIAQTKED